MTYFMDIFLIFIYKCITMQFYLFRIFLLEYLKFFNSNFFLIIDVIFSLNIYNNIFIF